MQPSLRVALIAAALSATVTRVDCGLVELFNTSSDNNLPELLDTTVRLANNDVNYFTKVDVIGPVEREVTFWCGNRKSPELRQTFLDDPDLKAKIDASKPIMFITHGWTDNVTKHWVQDMARDALTFFDTNVCGVGWANLAHLNYLESVKQTLVVSGYMTKFIQTLLDLGIPPLSVTLVGHSLGAQISGQVGFNFNGKLGQIFGLDPAGPSYTRPPGGPLSFRLDKSDAVYVQMIVTAKNVSGVSVAEAHENFFPDGGSPPSPNCAVPISSDAEFADVLLCSHLHAYTLFRLSMNPQNVYSAKLCPSWTDYMAGKCLFNRKTRMGIYSTRLGGDFYLRTSAKSPYTKAV
ncbi:hypothetical protein pipiens_003797 [Culex pipiens pipiens]|uniref:Lipase domain-containing protein n=1 Tax=Culex pipiens pipiens TaxID=38569 RepID=A0ABD1CSI2_CULPP